MDQALEPELGQHFPCLHRIVDVFGMQPVKIIVWKQLYLREFINPQTSFREFDDLMGVSKSPSLLKDKGCWIQDPFLCLLSCWNGNLLPSSWLANTKSRKNIHLQRNAENSVISQMFPISTSAYSHVISPL